MLKPNEKLLEFELTRVFDAPRARLWENWLDPDAVADWFAAGEYRVIGARIDPRVGGRWRVDFASDAGGTYYEHGTFTELDEPERLGFTMIQTFPGNSSPEMQVTVTLRDLGGRTELTFHQSGFGSLAHRDGMYDGWGECLDKLAAHIAQRSTK
jgi:uncharacterized protein YndB with AHSA1/START domain